MSHTMCGLSTCHMTMGCDNREMFFCCCCCCFSSQPSYFFYQFMWIALADVVLSDNFLFYRRKCNSLICDLTLKAPITTEADDIHKYFFIVFQRK